MTIKLELFIVLCVFGKRKGEIIRGDKMVTSLSYMRGETKIKEREEDYNDNRLYITKLYKDQKDLKAVTE